MPRKAIGGVIKPKQGRAWAIRFRAYGKRRYVALGTSDEGWTREKAEKKLGHVLADVERGIWKPEAPPPDQGPAIEPTFHEFASEWFEGVAPELRERTRIHYQWRLSITCCLTSPSIVCQRSRLRR